MRPRLHATAAPGAPARAPLAAAALGIALVATFATVLVTTPAAAQAEARPGLAPGSAAVSAATAHSMAAGASAAPLPPSPLAAASAAVARPAAASASAAASGASSTPSAGASPGRAAPAGLCRALAACIDGAALCVLVQVPAGQRARVLGSEAYADMESRLAALRSRHPDVRLVVQPQDLARTLGGVRAAAELRTLWVAAQGRALLTPGLYVDDTTPVEQYFGGPRLPAVLEGYAQPLVVQRRPGAC